jgi:DNA-binding transcriptional MerR regulator
MSQTPSTVSNPEELMTKSDVAKILGLTPAAVVLLEQKGVLPALRTAGGVRLFRRRQVERLARRRAQRQARDHAAPSK